MNRESDVVGVITYLSRLAAGEPRGAPRHAERIRMIAAMAFDLVEEYRLDHERVASLALDAVSAMEGKQ